MSDWTNLEEIMQDLSLAQGHAVPARLETVAAVGPPPLRVQEEGSVEQSYYESYCEGGGDFAPPDYTQIQTMLDLVKIDEEEEDPVNANKLNPLTPEFVPRHKIKEKIKLNVALSSLKTAKEAELAARRPIPRDVIPTMFMKKSLPPTEVRNENVLPCLTSPERTKQYVPSARANVYVSKYLKKTMLKEQIADDIWVKAEKQMKEIEKRQRLKAECTTKKRVADDVMLPDHRHMISDECMVCIVAAKHGYYF